MFSIKDWVETVHEYYGQFQTSPYHLLQLAGLLLIILGVLFFSFVASSHVSHKCASAVGGIIAIVAGIVLLIAPPVNPQTGISVEQPPTFGKMMEGKTGTSKLECTVLVTQNGTYRTPPTTTVETVPLDVFELPEQTQLSCSFTTTDGNHYTKGSMVIDASTSEVGLYKPDGTPVVEKTQPNSSASD